MTSFWNYIILYAPKANLGHILKTIEQTTKLRCNLTSQRALVVYFLQRTTIGSVILGSASYFLTNNVVAFHRPTSFMIVIEMFDCNCNDLELGD